MAKGAFYDALRQYKESRKITLPISRPERKQVIRVAKNFILKEGQLFYTGPNRQYMRLVVQSDAHKEAVLQECHSDPCTGKHNGIRSTRNTVVSTYYWSTITEDVNDWVKEPWEVVGMDLIGPLRATANKNQYILTMTDLYTKWVVAEALHTKSGTEVATAIVNKLYLFGMVRKVITKQEIAFVNELNRRIFKALNIKRVVTCAHHPETYDPIKKTNQNIKDALGKYANEPEDDWDLHLQAVVYGINTAKQVPTAETPYYRFFQRHPRIPEGNNTCPTENTLAMVEGDPEDELERALTAVKALNAEVLGNIETAQEQQKKASSKSRGKQARQRDVDVSGRPCFRPLLQDKHKEPSALPAASVKDEESVSREVQTVRDSRLVPYQLKEPKAENLEDHCYAASPTLADHQYASQGPLWLKECDALQDELMNYELDPSRPAFFVQEGNICLTRENIWSLGFQHYIDRNLHITIQKGGRFPELKRCSTCCTAYHCPFCRPSLFRPTKLSKVRAHLDSHFNRAVFHAEYTIHRCGLKCRPHWHYHCIYCKTMLFRKADFRNHLRICEAKQLPFSEPSHLQQPSLLQPASWKECT
ncbi:Gypsy retrotransposon integrase-like protein 1 [Takifugu flavidus]|uniref:Gypsy retrotransposon integrase-like protein 1 n=1 Tax=Takifugu flavidus TaxID=433684 RepID=A0A5C6N3W9_9TELE|nr:Gypsy retrotransposon integrase-like protein 1 [Takifugu flavidus]